MSGYDNCALVLEAEGSGPWEGFDSHHELCVGLFSIEWDGTRAVRRACSCACHQGTAE